MKYFYAYVIAPQKLQNFLQLTREIATDNHVQSVERFGDLYIAVVTQDAINRDSASQLQNAIN